MRPEEVLEEAEKAEPQAWVGPTKSLIILKGISSHYAVNGDGSYPSPDPEGRSRTGLWFDYVQLFSSLDVELDGQPLSSMADRLVYDPDYAVIYYGKKGRMAEWFEGDTLNVYFALQGDLSVSFTPSMRLMWPYSQVKLRVIGPSASLGALEFFGVLEAGETLSVRISGDGLSFKGWRGQGRGEGAWLRITPSWRGRKRTASPLPFAEIRTGLPRVDMALGACERVILKYFTPSSVGGGWFSAMPTFSWYLTRDGIWASLAGNRLGAHQQAREQLSLIAKYQIRQGAKKGLMPSEIVLNPAASPDKLETGYAAADSSSLWVMALADYVAWSGDYAYLREVRANLDMALEFIEDERRYLNGLFSNDPQSLLIGWPQSWAMDRDGPSVEVNAVTIRALEGAASLYSALGDERRAEELYKRAAKMAVSLSSTFSSGHGLLYDHLDASGRPVMVLTPYSAVAAAMGEIPAEQGKAIVERLGKPDFLTDWGIRSISKEDPRYEKDGFYSGAVHPSLTAFYALACYRYGFHEMGWRVLRRLLDLALSDQVGFINEVYSGDEPVGIGQPLSVAACALAILAFFDGMLGASPGAPPSFSPHLPEEVKEVKFVRGAQEFALK